MTIQLKKLAFLTPKAGLSDREFRSYWRNTHGPLVGGSPGYAQWRLRYVQNHIIDAGPVGESLAFSGMAEFWLPGEAPNEDKFSTTSIYLDRIRPDETNFIDMDRTISFSAIEEKVMFGSGSAKLVISSNRAPGMSLDAFRDRYRTDYASALMESFGGLLRGWTVNHAIEGTFRLPGARAVTDLEIDCVEELWFDSAEALRLAYSNVNHPRWEGTLFGPRQSFVAEEVVFFDAMQGSP